MKPSPTLKRFFRSILCPVDFSAQSRVALRAAAAIADRFDAQLTVLFVEDPLLAQAAIIQFDARALAKTAAAELRRFVQRATGRDVGERAIAYEIVSGRPATEIGKAVVRTSADLVVMGTQGQRGPIKLVLGSTTEAVLRHARVPVIAMPTGAARLVQRPGWPGKNIAAAIDLADYARSDVRAAATVARAFGASLLLVHVVVPTPGPPWLLPQLQEQDRTRLTKARDRLQKLSAVVKGAKVEGRVLLGDPAQEISAEAAESDAGLVILMLRQGRGLFAPRKGATTYRVLAGGATPVLAIPARQ